MKESRLKELNDFGKNKNDMLQKRHNDKMDRLNGQIKTLEESLTSLKAKNKAEELKMREDNKRADR
jgi:hypothetical protein